MRLLVTGGAGFIGSHLVDALLRDRHQVRVLDNLEPQVHGGRKPSYLNPQAEYHWADVRDHKAVRKALQGIEVVFHEASAVGVGQSMYEIAKYVSANALGTATLLDVIVREHVALHKLIVASSMSIYGEGSYRCARCGPVFPSLRPEAQLRQGRWEPLCPTCQQETQPQPTPEDKPLIPTSVYAVSKRDQEELCMAVGRAHRIPTVALRYFNVYGPRQALSNPYTGVCAIFSARIKNSRPPLIYEDGRQSRDFIHVSDVVRANVLVMTAQEANYRVFNVGTGEPARIVDISTILAQLYGVSVEPRLTGRYRAGDVRHCYADIRAIERLGFRPQVSLHGGLRELVEWGKQVVAEDRVELAEKELEAYGLCQG